MTVWNRICCPVDFSRESRFAMEEASALAWSLGAELTLLHVDERPAPPASGDTLAAPAALDRVALELERQLGEWADAASHLAARPATFALRAGVPADEIVRFAAEQRCDVIVMGTRGRGTRERLVFGSVAEAVLRTAPCSVVVTRGRVARAGDRLSEGVA